MRPGALAPSKIIVTGVRDLLRTHRPAPLCRAPRTSHRRARLGVNGPIGAFYDRRRGSTSNLTPSGGYVSQS